VWQNRKFGHKIGNIQKFEISKPLLILYRKYQKSGIDLVDKEKPFNCRNSLYSSSGNPVYLKAQDGENVGSHVCY